MVGRGITGAGQDNCSLSSCFTSCLKRSAQATLCFGNTLSPDLVGHSCWDGHMPRKWVL
jgi:hypothetical protein